MTTRAMAWLLGLYALGLVLVVLGIHVYAGLRPASAGEATCVVSVWSHGERLRREVRPRCTAPSLEQPSVTYVVERVIEVGRLSRLPLLFAMGLVPGREGVRADLDGKTAIVTPDDLLRAEAYDHAFALFDPSFMIGTNRALVLTPLAAQLGTDEQTVSTRASLTRIRTVREVGSRDRPLAPLAAPPVDVAEVRDDVRAAADHLTGIVDGEGRFRYLVDATTDATLPGYSLPRHAGATFFLARAAALLDDASVRWAALRAAQFLREASVPCGAARCVATGAQADVGSSALALVAFTELARTGADTSYVPAIRELAAFLRGQQRADGELMHVYDRTQAAPVDVQLLYFTGEAALGLARAHAITGDPRDLDAAKRALAYTVRRAWTFFGSRYFVNEEHWTCQAMAELWDRAPDETALRFCLDWHAYQARVQYGDETPFDAAGAYGAGPFVTPRLTSAASRAEALGATLHVLEEQRLRGRPHPEEPEVRAQLERAVGFLVRHQLRADRAPTYLYARSAVGAFPGSDVDPVLRIDYTQHAGSALVRYLTVADAARHD